MEIKIMKKLNNRKDANKLSYQSKTFFIGNKNEVRYYTDWDTGRNYARALFDWNDKLGKYTYDEWFQLSKDDIKDDDAFSRTETRINAYFGYFGRETDPFEL